MSTYVYGIVRGADAPDTADLTGVGDPPAPVRPVAGGGLAAVVSTAPEGLRAKRRDLTAHQEVLAELERHGSVLPLRFGSIAPDDAAVAAELERSSGHYLRLLKDLAGRVEVNVKAAHVEESALRTVLGQDPGLRAANEELRARGGGTPTEQIEFGERVAQALEALREHDADVLAAPLAAHADEVSAGQPVGDGFANLSLLVRRDRLDEVEREVRALQESQQGRMEIRMSGPLPPYSFVTGPPATADAPG